MKLVTAEDVDHIEHIREENVEEEVGCEELLGRHIQSLYPNAPTDVWECQDWMLENVFDTDRGAPPPEFSGIVAAAINTDPTARQEFWDVYNDL